MAQGKGLFLKNSNFVSEKGSEFFGNMQNHFQACLLLRVRITAEKIQGQTSLRLKVIHQKQDILHFYSEK